MTPADIAAMRTIVYVFIAAFTAWLLITIWYRERKARERYPTRFLYKLMMERRAKRRLRRRILRHALKPIKAATCRFIRWCKIMWWRSDPITIYRKWLGRKGWVTNEKGQKIARQGHLSVDGKEHYDIITPVPLPKDLR